VSAPVSPPETVGIVELAVALDTSRAAILRALARKTNPLPPADRKTLGGHRRWSLPLAVAILEREGRPVPPTWTAAASAAGGT
jgi:hypothetical protein